MGQPSLHVRLELPTYLLEVLHDLRALSSATQLSPACVPLLQVGWPCRHLRPLPLDGSEIRFGPTCDSNLLAWSWKGTVVVRTGRFKINPRITQFQVSNSLTPSLILERSSPCPHLLHTLVAGLIFLTSAFPYVVCSVQCVRHCHMMDLFEPHSSLNLNAATLLMRAWYLGLAPVGALQPQSYHAAGQRMLPLYPQDCVAECCPCSDSGRCLALSQFILTVAVFFFCAQQVDLATICLSSFVWSSPHFSDEECVPLLLGVASLCAPGASEGDWEVR